MFFFISFFCDSCFCFIHFVVVSCSVSAFVTLLLVAFLLRSLTDKTGTYKICKQIRKDQKQIFWTVISFLGLASSERFKFVFYVYLIQAYVHLQLLGRQILSSSRCDCALSMFYLVDCLWYGPRNSVALFDRCKCWLVCLENYCLNELDLVVLAGRRSFWLILSCGCNSS